MYSNPKTNNNPTFIVRPSAPDSMNKTSGSMTALEMIKYVRTLNPRARLIPYSRTYYNAVKEYNKMVKNTMVRPEVPDWFCGKVDTDTGLLEDDGGKLDNTNAGVVDNSNKNKDQTPSEYPWDQCVIDSNSSPGEPEYVSCNEEEITIDNEGGFMDDFDVSNLTGYEMEGGEGEMGVCDTSKCSDWGGMKWCFGGPKPGGSNDISLSIGGSSTRSIGTNLGNHFCGSSSDPCMIFGMCLQTSNGEWHCGKVDWISQSRHSRGTENITGHYSGWCTDGLASGKPFKAFVYTKDGKHQSGVKTGSF